uniref:Uncharacterized protein n=1 Tax=Rhizophora mucronata TaxID=61149 RepID=A0A2P2IP40_RHIMU
MAALAVLPPKINCPKIMPWSPNGTRTRRQFSNPVRCAPLQQVQQDKVFLSPFEVSFDIDATTPHSFSASPTCTDFR